MSAIIFQTNNLAEDVQAMQKQMRGQVILPSDPHYDEVRRVWNGMIDRRPALIVHCLGASDVIAAVNLAREH